MNKEVLAPILNHYLSLATIFGAVLLTIFVGYLLYRYITKTRCSLIDFVADKIIPFGFFITIVGAFMTLFYSDYLMYPPCDLCWFQRIFLYPQVILFGIAWYKKDRNILPYTGALSFVGLAIAAYHHMLQIGYDMYKPCSSAPFAVDCAKPSFVEYGFVTFPFMAVVLFGFLLAFHIASSLSKNK